MIKREYLINTMTTDFGKIIIEQKTGEEPLIYNNQKTGLNLLDFWRWSASNILGNTERGVFAEFIVASSLKIDLKGIRNDWEAYDLTSPEGIRIEVKSSAYLQTWQQKDFSKISFSIKATRSWDSFTNMMEPIPKRDADIYVFCLLKHKDQATLDPLNLDQWEFYVVSTKTVNNYKRSQSSITLKSLQNLTSSVGYDQLRHEILEKHEISSKI